MRDTDRRGTRKDRRRLMWYSGERNAGPSGKKEALVGVEEGEEREGRDARVAVSRKRCRRFLFGLSPRVVLRERGSGNLKVGRSILVKVEVE